MKLKTYNAVIPFTLLHEIYPPSVEYRQKLVKRVIEQRKEVSTNASQFLQEVLKGSGLKIDGFRNAFQAPTNKLLPPMLDAAWQFSDVTVGILDIWYELEAKLAQELKNYLIEHDFELNQGFADAVKNKQFQVLCDGRILAEFLDSFSESHPAFDKEALPLMFVYLTGVVPVSQEIIAELDSASISYPEPNIEAMLNTIQHWDAENLHWQRLPAFLDDLSRLAEYKMALAQSNPLKNALEALQAHESLSFFEMESLKAWDATNISEAESKQIAEDLQNLLSAMNEYLPLLNLVPANLEEQRRNRQRLGELEDDIVILRESLSREFDKAESLEKQFPIDMLDWTGSPYLEWLQSLAAFSAESDLWAEIPHISAAIQSIFGEVTNSQATEQKLSNLFVLLNNLDADLLSFFQIEPANWSKKPDPRQDIIDLESDIELLVHSLTNYQALQAEKPTKFDEVRKQRHELSNLENEIVRIIKTINLSFNQATGNAETSQSELEPLETIHEKTLEPREVLLTENLSSNTVPVIDNLELDILTDDDLVAATVSLPKDSSQFVIYTERLVWQLISEGRLSTAYQLLKISEELNPGFSPQFRSWLLKAVLLARQIRYAAGDIASQLKTIFGFVLDKNFPELDYNKPDELSSILLILAASLRPALIAPQTYAVDVLRTFKMPNGLSAVYEYQQRIIHFAHGYRALEPAILMRVKDDSSWSLELQNLQKQVSAWLEETRKIAFGFQPAAIVWQQWHSHDGYFHELLSPILSNEQSAQERLQAELENHLSNDEQIRSIILRDYNNTASKRGRSRVKTLETRALATICNKTYEVSEFLRRWLELQKAKQVSHQAFDQQRAEDLRRDIFMLHPKVINSIEAFSKRHDEINIQVALSVLSESIQDIYQLFNSKQSFATGSIHPRFLLNIDLLKIPEIGIDEEWNPKNVESEKLHELFLNYVHQPEIDWSSLYARYEQEWNHEATQAIIDYFQSPLKPNINVEISTLISVREKQIQASSEILREFTNRVDEEIEKSVAYGFLNEEERQELRSIVIAVRAGLASNLDFHRKRQQLNGVLEILEQARQEKVKDLRERSEKLLISDDSDLVLLEKAIEAGDIVTANEYIEMLKNGQSPSFTIAQQRNPFTEFFPKLAQDIETYLESFNNNPRQLLRNIEEQRIVKGINLQFLHKSQLAEAVRMMRAWLEIKAANPNNQSIRNNLEILLTAFGFSNVSLKEDRSQTGNTWFDMEAQTLRDREVCPVPIYGSAAKGHYRVLCIWNRPAEDRILEAVSETSLRFAPVIVLYFGRMTELRSRDLAQFCRERRRSFILIDEKMVLFLCGERGLRLPTLFALTLPFTFYEPYTITSGIVPPEMFYGRSQEQASIMSVDGSCFIYGGRQLGKTVLLRAVEREFHNPDEGRIAIWLDLKAEGIGYGRRHLEDLWRLLSDYLMRTNGVDFIPNAVNDPHRLFNYINDWLEENPGRRILFLLDESDKFLEEDGEQKFSFSSEIKGWMDKTERRIKVVFAGLHNVLRTTTQSNHPLAHYGEPICIGPLINDGESREARRLVEFPLQTLGYEFEAGTDLITRILSQTNYYPSLLQIYCSKLLSHVNSRPTGMTNIPPYIITSNQVDEVYHRADLRELIRDRFKLTLQLDQRYEVIANVLARHSLLDEAEYLVEGYEIEWIRKEAEFWWPQGFKDNASNDSFRVLLQEMEGLGILRLTSHGKYVLRSPNVSLLMGKTEEIEASLLRERETPSPYEPAKFRPTFDGYKCSPLTAQQEAALRSRQHGISIVFGTKASGIDELLPYLKHSFSEQIGIIEFKRDRHQFSTQLHQLIEQREREGTTLLVVAHNCIWDEDWIIETHKKLSNLRAKKAFVRVLFIADASHTQLLVKNSSELLESLEKGDSSIQSSHLLPWDNSAVNTWLSNNEFLTENLDAKKELSLRTGNWSSLLYIFYEIAKNQRNNWRSAIKTLEMRLAEPARRTEILQQFGITDKSSEAILRILAEWQDEPLTEEIIQEFANQPLHMIRDTLNWAKLLNMVHSKLSDKGETIYRLNYAISDLLLGQAADA
jgi:hypothetical protein